MFKEQATISVNNAVFACATQYSNNTFYSEEIAKAELSEKFLKTYQGWIYSEAVKISSEHGTILKKGENFYQILGMGNYLYKLADAKECLEILLGNFTHDQDWDDTDSNLIGFTELP